MREETKQVKEPECKTSKHFVRKQSSSARRRPSISSEVYESDTKKGDDESRFEFESPVYHSTEDEGLDNVMRGTYKLTNDTEEYQRPDYSVNAPQDVLKDCDPVPKLADVINEALPDQQPDEDEEKETVTVGDETGEGEDAKGLEDEFEEAPEDGDSMPKLGDVMKEALTEHQPDEEEEKETVTGGDETGEGELIRGNINL